MEYKDTKIGNGDYKIEAHSAVWISQALINPF